MGGSQIKGTILGVPIIRIVIFWGLYWGPPIFGNYHISVKITDHFPGEVIPPRSTPPQSQDIRANKYPL